VNIFNRGESRLTGWIGTQGKNKSHTWRNISALCPDWPHVCRFPPVNNNWKFRSFLPVFVKLHLDSIMIVSSRLLGPPIILGPSSELLERPPSLRRPFESPRIMDSKDMPLRRPRENHRCPWAPWVFVCAEHRRWPAEDQRETPGRTWSSFHQEPRHSCQKCSKEWGRRWCKGRSRWSTRKVRSASLPFLLLDWNLELEREFWFK